MATLEQGPALTSPLSLAMAFTVWMCSSVSSMPYSSHMAYYVGVFTRGEITKYTRHILRDGDCSISPSVRLVKKLTQSWNNNSAGFVNQNCGKIKSDKKYFWWTERHKSIVCEDERDVKAINVEKDDWLTGPPLCWRLLLIFFAMTETISFIGLESNDKSEHFLLL